MQDLNLSGVIVPVITTVDGEDQVDEPAFRKLIRNLIESGIHGIFAGGTAGEGPLLTTKEWERTAGIAFEECRGEIPLLGGAMDTSTKRIIERIRILARIGYTSYVVAPPFYAHLNLPEEFLRLFGECKESSPGLEMIVYNIPSLTGSTIPIETVREVARRGWVRYCKESSGDMNYFRQLLTESKAIGLRVLLGSEDQAAEGLGAGACGLVPVSANYDPHVFILAYYAATTHDADDLSRRQLRIESLAQHIRMSAACWIAAIKYAVACSTGIGSGKPVSPLQPLNDEERKRIRAFVNSDLGERMNEAQESRLVRQKAR
jgi:4-hydroxy-tetrahydrodipicolinate synthase